jgi:hypothetical protein
MSSSNWLAAIAGLLVLFVGIGIHAARRLGTVTS